MFISIAILWPLNLSKNVATVKKKHFLHEWWNILKWDQRNQQSLSDIPICIASHKYQCFCIGFNKDLISLYIAFPPWQSSHAAKALITFPFLQFKEKLWSCSCVLQPLFQKLINLLWILNQQILLLCLQSSQTPDDYTVLVAFSHNYFNTIYQIYLNVKKLWSLRNNTSWTR